MLDTNLRRWIVGAIAVFGVVALLAWARNDAGVDDRDPDPPQSTQVIADSDTVPSLGTAVDTDPPTT